MVWWIMFHTHICEVELLRFCSGFGNYSLLTRFNCLSEQGWLGGGGGGGVGGVHGPTCFAANTLALYAMCGWRGAWVVVPLGALCLSHRLLAH